MSGIARKKSQFARSLTRNGGCGCMLIALSRVSRLLRDRGTCEKLRGATSADALYALLTGAAAG